MGIHFGGGGTNNLFHYFFWFWNSDFSLFAVEVWKITLGGAGNQWWFLSRKNGSHKKKEMHAFLGRVALMENDGNRDKHPCLSDGMEVEISDVFSSKKSHRQSSNILVSWNLNRKQNQPMPAALTMNDGCFTRAKHSPEPELRAISAKIAKYCKVYATKIISTNTEPKKNFLHKTH